MVQRWFYASSLTELPMAISRFDSPICSLFDFFLLGDFRIGGCYHLCRWLLVSILDCLEAHMTSLHRKKWWRRVGLKDVRKH
jgi:hypothetical protein